jgi:hypothetical protein
MISFSSFVKEAKRKPAKIDQFTGAKMSKVPKAKSKGRFGGTAKGERQLGISPPKKQDRLAKIKAAAQKVKKAKAAPNPKAPGKPKKTVTVPAKGKATGYRQTGAMQDKAAAAAKDRLGKVKKQPRYTTGVASKKTGQASRYGRKVVTARGDGGNVMRPVKKKPHEKHKRGSVPKRELDPNRKRKDTYTGGQSGKDRKKIDKQVKDYQARGGKIKKVKSSGYTKDVKRIEKKKPTKSDYTAAKGRQGQRAMGSGGDDVARGSRRSDAPKRPQSQLGQLARQKKATIGGKGRKRKWEEVGFMKRFRDMNEDAPGAGVGVVQHTNQTGGSEPYDIQNADVLKRVNAFVGSIADREYLIPENAVHQLQGFLERIGLCFEMPELPEGNGTVKAQLLRYGGVFGKSTDTPFNEFDREPGIDKSISITVESLRNNSWKVYAKIV